MDPYISDFGLGRLANIAGDSPYAQSDRVGLEKGQNQQSNALVSPLVSKGSCYQAPEVLKTLRPCLTQLKLVKKLAYQQVSAAALLRSWSKNFKLGV
jgi:hypothetical protein